MGTIEKKIALGPPNKALNFGGRALVPLDTKGKPDSSIGATGKKILQEKEETAVKAQLKKNADTSVSEIKIIKKKDWLSEKHLKQLAQKRKTKSLLIDTKIRDTIVLHHSGNRISSHHEIASKHLDNFDDIGYHYIIGKNGDIYEGREIIYKGAHVGDENPGKIGIVIVGDYSERKFSWRGKVRDFAAELLTDADDLPDVQIGKAKELILHLKELYPSIIELGGHQDYNEDRYCPGEVAYKALEKLREYTDLKGPNTVNKEPQPNRKEVIDPIPKIDALKPMPEVHPPWKTKSPSRDPVPPLKRLKFPSDKEKASKTKRKDQAR